MSVVLAMDIGSQMGWALHKPGMPKPFFGTESLAGTPEKVGGPMQLMYEFLNRQHQLHGGLTDIIFEAQHVGVRKKKRKDGGEEISSVDINVIRKLIALGAMAEWFAHCIDARCFIVHIGTWRKHFCGKGNLNRQQAKQIAVDECRRLGIDPPDDNAAEAFGILDYYLSIRKIAKKPYPVPWRDVGFFTPLGHHG